MPNAIDLSAKIEGWGADLLPDVRPGVPKESTPPRGTGAHWKEPEQQKANVKINVSIERKGLTPVFGTSCPPRGLSGWLRNFGYTIGEGMIAHWLVLFLADRVDVVESALIEMLQGKGENPFSEMGLGSEFKSGGRIHQLKSKLAESHIPPAAQVLALATGVGAVGLITAGLISRQTKKTDVSA